LTAYFISGLGADEKIFNNIVLPDSISVKHVHWIEPLPKETFQHYCSRLLVQIDQTEEFVLIGLSFGGMVAIELSKSVRPRKIIIISTVATHHEFPLQFRLAKALHLTSIIPPAVLKIPNPLSNWFFSVKTKEEKELLRYFLKNVTPSYMRWSMNAVLNWKNGRRPGNLVHIHGNDDRIFPVGRTHADYIIRDTGHFMVYDQAEKISKLLTLLICEAPAAHIRSTYEV
jgi:pimeloyl-ACP methyl ester carboxylesterase